MINLITKVPSMVKTDSTKLTNIQQANLQTGQSNSSLRSNGTLPQSIANLQENRGRLVNTTDNAAAMQAPAAEASIVNRNAPQGNLGPSNAEVSQQAATSGLALANSAPASNMAKLLSE
ncbi:MAG: hypothetical protein HQK81_06970 [Desulfovibrionaceae bacterium]|nr:hypothetical protein [Desulfovibrionaceae bacterium]MBF0513792.1 hypothetical protein [Desulfovibrionaceae bacterium]